MHQGPIVDIIVASDGDEPSTRACLENVRACTESGHRVILVAPSTAIAGTASADDLVVPVEPATNLAGQLNAGIARASAPFLCTLSSDTRVAGGWLRQMLGVLAKDKAVGVVGPITSRDRDWQGLRYLSTRWQLDLPVNEIPSADSDQWNRYLRLRFPRTHVEIDGFLGLFCALARRDVIAAAGPFDEGLAYGTEAEDFAYRVQRTGAGLALCLQAYVTRTAGGEALAAPHSAESYQKSLAHLAAKWPDRYRARAS